MKNAVFCRSAYNYDRDAVSEETGLACLDVTRAQQNFAEECDINTIVRRFGLTGQLPSNVKVPQYGDFDQVVDYHSAMNLVAQANEAFDQMPASVRSRFANDPGAFVDFCSDPANAAEMGRMGLLTPGVGSPPPEGVVIPSEAVLEPSPNEGN